MSNKQPLHLGVCLVDGKLHATVMRCEVNNHITVVATAEIDESVLRRPGYDTHAVMQPAVDTQRLDWLETQGHSYGFQDMHEGNRWLIEGPFPNLRAAIDAGMKS